MAQRQLLGFISESEAKIPSDREYIRRWNDACTRATARAGERLEWVQQGRGWGELFAGETHLAYGTRPLEAMDAFLAMGAARRGR